MRPLYPVALLGLLVPGGCRGPEYVEACQRTIDRPAEPIPLTVAPWVQLARTSIRMRLETELNGALPVVLHGVGSCPLVREAEREVHSRTWSWPAEPEQATWPDLPGEHVRHELDEVLFDPGERIGWEVEWSPDDVVDGSFRVPPVGDASFRAVFVGDTFASSELAEQMAAVEPDLFLHGGDLQERVEVEDTWTGFFARMAPVTSLALLHLAVGDLDEEVMVEFPEMYEGFFGGQGRAGGRTRYYAFDYGAVRFVALDATVGLDRATSVQVGWLEDELRDVSREERLRHAVIFLHAAPWTLAGDGPALAVREVLHPILVEHGVPLVLTAQEASYERFVVDGVTYVVDGGGGAPLADPDALLGALPEDAALRLASSATHGFTVVDVTEDGRIELLRLDLDGTELDSTVVVD